MAERKRLSVGDPAPDFELVASNGQTVKLSDLRGKSVVLFFFPKTDTPGFIAGAEPVCQPEPAAVFAADRPRWSGAGPLRDCTNAGIVPGPRHIRDRSGRNHCP
jgi:AhpC/TSA family